MGLPIKYEHTKFVHCESIVKLREELSNDNTNYCLVKRNQEKYIRELIRFLILKLYHRDFKTKDNNKHEDVIVPLDNEVESLWILFLSHTNDYKTFLTTLSMIYCDTPVFFARNFDGNLSDNDSKKNTSRILYKNRYGTLPDFQIEDCFLNKYSFEIDSQNGYYFEGSCYPTGRWKTGIIVYCCDTDCSDSDTETTPEYTEYYFIGTLADNDDVAAGNYVTGKLYFMNGTVEEYFDGIKREENGDDESVGAVIPVASLVD